MDPAETPPDRPSIGALFARLVDQGEDFIRAEVALYRAEAGRKLFGARWIVILFAGGLVLGQGAIIALLVGLILALTPHIGPGWATLAVIGATFTVVAILFALGARRLGAFLPREDDTP